MLVTRKADYALRCVVSLAADPDRVWSAQEIANQTGIPDSFVAKVLQSLCRSGLLNSSRGVHGGYQLARSIEEITVLDVVESIQGPLSINVCVMEDGTCTRSATCVAHPLWGELKRMMEQHLSSRSVGELVRKP